LRAPASAARLAVAPAAASAADDDRFNLSRVAAVAAADFDAASPYSAVACPHAAIEPIDIQATTTNRGHFMFALPVASFPRSSGEAPTSS
jgi:hypothetical protein